MRKYRHPAAYAPYYYGKSTTYIIISKNHPVFARMPLYK